MNRIIETAIIIANWNGKSLLADCLDSLSRQTCREFEAIVIDNGSVDGSVDFVKESYPWVKIVALDTNTGFAHANNLGINEAFKNEKIKYIITLNNDARADENYVHCLLKAAERHSDFGSLQPKVINFYDQGTIDSAGILIYPEMSAISRGYKEKDNGQYEKEEEIFGASASAALYAREALEKTKFSEGEYFDSDYFAYYEDVDLAWRMRLAGFKAFYIPSAKVYHAHSATGQSFSAFKAFHIHRNQYYNIIKNMPGMFFWKALFLIPVRYAYLISSIFKKKGPAAKLSEKSGKAEIFSLVLRSWVDVFRNLPALIRKRKHVQAKRNVSNREMGRWFKKYGARKENIFYN